MAKILYINPEETGIWNEYFEEVLGRAARPGTEIDVTHLPLGKQMATRVSIARTGDTYPPYIPLSQGAMFRALMQAEADGYDAAIIGCSADPGLDMAKRTVAMPVTAPLEAGLYLAAMLRQRVAVLIPAGFDDARTLYEDLAHAYGVERRIASVAYVDVEYPPDEYLQRLMDEDPAQAREVVLNCHRESVNKEVTRLAKQAIEEHGAGVVYCGCTLWTGMLDSLAEELGVPVIDPGIGALRVAEILADTMTSPSTRVKPVTLAAV
jgi:allantoin racemase